MRSGHIAVHRRGYTTVPAAVQGYARFLRENAARAESNASAARSHQAKATTVAAANGRRRTGLLPRSAVEELLDAITNLATEGIADLTVAGIGPAMATRVADEAKLATADIRAACDRAIAVLRGETSYGN